MRVRDVVINIWLILTIILFLFLTFTGNKIT
ncbi:hypothetical protein EDD75_1540 [Thermodesulfitimonas autotrophica]|uniref:Uncharacterized protein n=1 Tax=Thermodesulfitimonas autotrophica TaxID=1894989 RepID=A0A3N5A9T7_9THEO|nr:hypothetical protein EDD75_1540 [Thermodesulfitimonas autotrophica]